MQLLSWRTALLAYLSTNACLTILAAPTPGDASIPAIRVHHSASLKRQTLQNDINEFLSWLPDDDIRDLFEDYIRSPEKKKRAFELPPIEELRRRLRELGYDIEAIEQFVRDLFGWST